MRRDLRASSAGLRGAGTSIQAAMLAAALATAVLAICAIATTAAQAAQSNTYVPSGSFAGEPLGSGNGQLAQAHNRIAVDTVTGNVLVADTGNKRVQVFDPSGDSATYLTQFGGGALSAPFGLAIDQSNGDVYVSDRATNKIVKFNTDRAAVPTFSVDNEFISPAQGTAEGQVANFAAALGVDPGTQELVVADTGNGRVLRFGPDGAFVDSFDGLTSPDGPFPHLDDIAVEADGDIVTVTRLDAAGAIPTRAEVYDGDGNYQYALGAPNSNAGLVAIDPDSGNVILASTNAWYDAGGLRIWVFRGPTLLSQRLVSNLFASGLAYAPGAPGRLYLGITRGYECCVEYGVSQILVLRPDTEPEVTIDPPASIGPEQVSLSGTVNAGGRGTNWVFEYSSDGGSTWQGAYPIGDAGAGEAAVPVARALGGLRPNTSYLARLRAESVGGVRRTEAVSFETAEAGPAIGRPFVAPRTTTTARLNARIDPLGLATTYFFEFGETGAYGRVAPAAPASVGSGDQPRLASAQIDGLTPGTTYHYRVVAENAAGRTESADRTFVTRTATAMSPPARGMELVNPPDKGAQHAGGGYVTPDGRGMIWSSQGTSPASPIGVSMLRSTRTLTTPSGWTSLNALPPLAQLRAGFTYEINPLAMSPDGADVLVQAVDQTNKKTSLEIVDVEAAQARVLHTFDRSSIGDFNTHGVMASEHLERVFANTSEKLSAAHMGTKGQVYEVAAGAPRLVSLLPDGSAPTCGVPNHGFARNELYDNNSIVPWSSADGSRIVFASQGDDCGGPLRLFMRDLTTEETEVVSPNAIAGPEGDSYFIGMSDDGRRTLFTSPARLAEVDENEGIDAYLWRAGAGVSCLTCVVPAAEIHDQNDVIAAPDLSRFYFVSSAQLAPGAALNPTGTNLYVWHDGEIGFVAPYAGKNMDMTFGRFVLTPDGAVAAFYSSAPDTTASSCALEECRYLYLYDDRDDSIECVNCQPPGVPFGISSPPSLGLWALRANVLSDDGETLAFVTEMPLLREDINATDDLYEWRNGTISLVTDGATEFPNIIVSGISADARDVYFSTAARLTGFELDGLSQIFDARVGGGFSLPSPPATCTEDSCQGPLVAPPPLTGPGSATLQGPGNAQAGKKPKKSSKKKRSKKKQSRSKSKKRSGKTTGKRSDRR